LTELCQKWDVTSILGDTVYTYALNDAENRTLERNSFWLIHPDGPGKLFEHREQSVPSARERATWQLPSMTSEYCEFNFVFCMA